jgi:hypothetical protein
MKSWHLIERVVRRDRIEKERRERERMERGDSEGRGRFHARTVAKKYRPIPPLTSVATKTRNTPPLRSGQHSRAHTGTACTYTKSLQIDSVTRSARL